MSALSKDDKDLLDLLVKTPEAGLARIFDAYYEVLFQRVYRVLYDKQATEDVVQEIFLTLWQKRQELEINTSLGAYLNKMAVNRALNFIRDHRKRSFTEDSILVTVPSETPGALASLGLKELEQVIHNAIEALPDRCRLVFSLSRFEDMSYKEIAEELDISVKTVENQILKALKLLRLAVAEFREEEDRGRGA